MSRKPIENDGSKQWVLNSISFASRASANILLVICGVFLMLMMAHVCIDIFLKLAFNRPLIGTLETVSYYYMVSIVFLPLAYVELRNEHVYVDLFFRLMPNKLQLIVYLFGATLSAGYIGVLCYRTGLDALKALQEQETIMSNFLFYVWPSRWALPVGFAAFLLAILSNATRAFCLGSAPETLEPGGDPA